jgi:hypothetical protein
MKRSLAVAQASSLPYRGFPIRALLTALLLGPLSLALAQFAIPWSTLAAGGGTSSGGVFRVTGTVGQPDAGGVMTGGNFTLTGGFWALPLAVQTPDAPTLTILPAAPGFATISWSPATGTTWVLQYTPTLEPPAWADAPSGASNPVTVPATLPAGFYRLIRR